jgi:serine/threonine protein kinase
MQSAVGTLSYNCPEIVQHQQYSDKADLWSVGCILYHLIALKPPFNDENPLVLANSIVEGNFKPLRASLDCSERLVNWCTHCSHPRLKLGLQHPASQA